MISNSTENGVTSLTSIPLSNKSLQEMSDDDLAKARVQFNPALWRKLSSSFMDWNNQFYEQDDEEQFETLMYLINQYELTCNTKLQAMTATTEQDTHLLQMHIQELESSLEKQQTQLHSLQELLKREQINLQHRKEYDALSGVILQYKDRRAQSDLCDELTKQLESLEKENERLIQLIELRHKQFALLMHTIDELQVTLEEPVDRTSLLQKNTPKLTDKPQQQLQTIANAQSEPSDNETIPKSITITESATVTTSNDSESSLATTTTTTASENGTSQEKMEVDTS